MIIQSMQTENREPGIINKKDIPKLFTKEIHEIFHCYDLTNRYGFPKAGGWAEQPAIAMDIISTLDNEKDIFRSNNHAS